MRFTQQNLDASFSLAHELAEAKDLAEALQIQSRHAQQQMHAYALQAQELGNLVNAAAQKGKQGSSAAEFPPGPFLCPLQRNYKPAQRATRLVAAARSSHPAAFSEEARAKNGRNLHCAIERNAAHPTFWKFGWIPPSFSGAHNAKDAKCRRLRRVGDTGTEMATLEISSVPAAEDRDEEMSAPGLRKNFERHLRRTLARDRFSATNRDRYFALALAVRTSWSSDGSRPSRRITRRM